MSACHRITNTQAGLLQSFCARAGALWSMLDRPRASPHRRPVTHQASLLARQWEASLRGRDGRTMQVHL